MAQRVRLGMFFVMCAAVATTASVVCAKMIATADLPFWSVHAVGESLSSIIFGTSIALSRPPLPGNSQAVWMLIRTALRTFSFGSALVALQVGATPGDVAALTSINTVVAAVMGHYFLREKLRPIHVSALGCTIAGTVLITQPAFIFGGSRDASPYLGYLLAMASGFMKAGDFIAARKSPDVSTSVGSFLAAVGALFLFFVFALSAGEPQSLGALQVAPWVLLVWSLAVCFTDCAAVAANTAGAGMCPAAVGATLYTGSKIVLGYASQALIFDLVPRPFTLLGATLLLIAVGIMSATRVQSKELAADHALNDQAFGIVSNTVRATCAASAASTAELAACAGGANTPEAMDVLEEDETDSIASIVSFMATEFAMELSDTETETVRLRRPAGQSNTKQAPQAIGAAMAVAVVAV